MTRFGRAALRVLYALDRFRDVTDRPRADLVLRGKVLPGWAVRLVVGTLLLPPLLVGVDAFARLRRRREPVTRWIGWTLAGAVPFLMACLFAVGLAAVGLLGAAPGAPIAPPGLALGAGAIAGFIAITLLFLLGWLVVRPVLGRVLVGRARPDTPGAAIAVSLSTTAVVLALWVGNPYAAALAVPAVHVWMWTSSPDVPLPRAAGAALVLAALAPLALLGIVDDRAFGLDVVHAVWFWILLVAGGHVPFGAWVLWSLLAGCAVAATLIALRGRRPTEGEPQDVTVRGPVTYAGPGSLGGTESALRR